MVFSLSAERELQRKPFAGIKNASDSVALINLCIEHTRKVTDESGLPVVWFDERLQHGHSFADRYTNAIQECFNAGYDRVVSIGNDSPDLTTADIHAAARRLACSDLVLGPAADGGVYLLGINHGAFNAGQFAALPWQEKDLFKSIIDQATTDGQTVELLETLIDLDDLATVLDFAARRPTSVIGSFVLRVLLQQTSRKVPPYVYAFIKPTLVCSVSPFRGPPVH